MIRIFSAFLLAACLLARGAAAQSAELYEALGLPEIVEIMAEEGRLHGEEVEADMFGRGGGPSWDAYVAAVYDPDRMDAELRAKLLDALAPVDLDPLLAFFRSERGRRIVGLEVSAREALIDPAVEEAAIDAVGTMRKRRDPRLDLLRDFAEANDLIESNVAGSMTSSLAFFEGLAEGGAFEDGLSEEEMLATVWGQEQDIRRETREWVYAYLALAFEPLSDADVEAYTALSQTPEGRALTGAMFRAFDEMLADIARRLGLGAARFMAGEDI